MHRRGFRNNEKAEMRSSGKLGYFRPVELLSTKYLKLVTERPCPDKGQAQRELNGTGNILFLTLMTNTQLFTLIFRMSVWYVNTIIPYGMVNIAQ